MIYPIGSPSGISDTAADPKPVEILPEGVFKLLFAEEKSLILTHEELGKFPFFGNLPEHNCLETNDRIIDFRENPLITFEIFEMVRKTMHAKKRDIFRDPDLSLLEDPLFFDRISACLAYLYPGVETDFMERLHRQILHFLDIDLCVTILNGFYEAQGLTPQGTFEKYTLEELFEAYKKADGWAIILDAIDCMIVAKTIFKGSVAEADKFFRLFHGLLSQITYLKAKHVEVASAQLECLREAFCAENSSSIKQIERKLAQTRQKMNEIRELFDKDGEVSNEESFAYKNADLEYRLLRNEREALSGTALEPIQNSLCTFSTLSADALKRQLASLCFEVMRPKAALTLIQCEDSTPLQQKIAQLIMDEFQYRILEHTLKDTRLCFPFRGDIVYWCTRLLAYYDFTVVHDHLVQPFQLDAASKLTLKNPGYSTGFSYLFQKKTPADQQEEIREDLRQCGMTDEDLPPPMKDVPTVSETYLELNRGQILILKNLFREINRVEEIPHFHRMMTFLELLDHYWEYIRAHKPNTFYINFINYLFFGKPWNLHAQTPTGMERLLREKLTTYSKYSYQNEHNQSLLDPIGDYDHELDENTLRVKLYDDVVHLPDPLYDK